LSLAVEAHVAFDVNHQLFFLEQLVSGFSMRVAKVLFKSSVANSNLVFKEAGKVVALVP
jgi:hypothetical protein